MKRTLFVGLLVAVIGGLGLFIADAIGLTLTDTMVGVGAGAIAGMVHIGTPVQRLIGFLVGFALGVFFISMLMGLIPGGGSMAGVSVAFAVVLIVVALVHGFSNAKIHAGIMLLGVFGFAASVYPGLSANPLSINGQIVEMIATQLAMAMIGFLAVVPATFMPDKTSLAHRERKTPTPSAPVDQTPADSTQDSVNKASLDEIIGGTR